MLQRYLLKYLYFKKLWFKILAKWKKHIFLILDWWPFIISIIIIVKSLKYKKFTKCIYLTRLMNKCVIIFLSRVFQRKAISFSKATMVALLTLCNTWSPPPRAWQDPLCTNKLKSNRMKHGTWKTDCSINKGQNARQSPLPNQICMLIKTRLESY